MLPKLIHTFVTQCTAQTSDRIHVPIDSSWCNKVTRLYLIYVHVLHFYEHTYPVVAKYRAGRPMPPTPLCMFVTPPRLLGVLSHLHTVRSISDVLERGDAIKPLRSVHSAPLGCMLSAWPSGTVQLGMISTPRLRSLRRIFLRRN